MSDYSTAEALNLLRRSAPFWLFRIAVHGGIALCFPLAAALGAAGGWALGVFGGDGFQDSAMLYGGIAAVVLTAAVLRGLRAQRLYLVEAGHMAVLVALLDEEDMPTGKAQIGRASDRVKARFGGAADLFDLDRMIKRVLPSVTGLVQGILSALPLPHLRNTTWLLRAWLRLAVGLMDEIILAQVLRSGSATPWEAGRMALVLYAQNARDILIKAAWLAAFVWGLSLGVFVLMLAPAGAVAAAIPGGWPAWGPVFALVFAAAVKRAVIDPYAMACLLLLYFKRTDSQTPNPDWDSKLDNVSEPFREMGARAQGAAPEARGSFFGRAQGRGEAQGG
jgi:hypothetical protein